jgi:hypothetical protein
LEGIVKMPKIKVGNKYLTGFKVNERKGGIYTRCSNVKMLPEFSKSEYYFSVISISGKVSQLLELMRFDDIKKESIVIEW